MKKLISTILILAAAMALIGCSESPVRDRMDFNDGWTFNLGDVPEASAPDFDDSAWRTLNLPHDWAVEGDFDRKNPPIPKAPAFNENASLNIIENISAKSSDLKTRTATERIIYPKVIIGTSFSVNLAIPAPPRRIMKNANTESNAPVNSGGTKNTPLNAPQTAFDCITLPIVIEFIIQKKANAPAKNLPTRLIPIEEKLFLM